MSPSLPRSSSSSGSTRSLALHPELEPLEPRRLLDAFSVTSLADDGSVGTFRWAIDQANGLLGADTITFDGTLAGTITLGGTELSVIDPVTIQGPGADRIAVSGNNLSRVFKVDDGDSFTSLVVAISGLTITGGLSRPAVTEDGGGIDNRESLTLTDCLITANATADETASLWNGGYGGAVYNEGTLTMNHCTVSNNSTGDGGPDGGSGGLGGGLCNVGTLTMSNCTVSNNSTGDGSPVIGGGGDGGGICSFGTLTMTQCTVSDNTTGNGSVGGEAGCGGGLYNLGTLTMTDCTVSDNCTGEDGMGGGIYIPWLSEVTIRNSTLYGNQAQGSDGYGGGIWVGFASLDLESTILAGNTATFGPDYYGDDVLTDPSAEYCLIGNNKDCNTIFPAADPGTNIIGTNPDPIDPLLGPLVDNGGPTKTHALLAGSPAIDHGANTQGLSDDQRGGPFVREWPTGQPDIGAYERQIADLPPLVVDTLVDENDGDYGPGDLSLREALVLANGSIGADTVSFAEGLTGSILLASGALSIRDDVTINGPGPATLTVDGNLASRVFLVDDGTGAQASVAISGLTITRGTVPEGHDGGGIYNNENLILGDCVITDNHTTDGISGDGGDGGGIYSYGSLSMTGCVVSANTTGDGGVPAGGGTGDGGDGGAIYSQGSVTMTNCTISGNSSGDGSLDGGVGGSGGGIYSTLSLAMTHCSVSNNAAGNGGNGRNSIYGTSGGDGGGGGGIWSDGTLVMANCTVSGNTAGNGGDTDASAASGGDGGDGGGIWSQGTVTMSGCTISANATGDRGSGGSMGAGGRGAGIYQVGTLTMANCTVSGNSTADDGGGVFVSGAGTVANVWNCTIASNTAQAGGGIYRETGSIFVESTIFNNSGTGGAPDVFGAVTSLGHNLVNVDSGSSGWIPGNGDLLNVGPKLSPLADNGGPTQTHALQFDSPAIDHGTNPLALTTDQRGAPFLRAAGPGGPDIGAYERQTADIPPLVVDTLVDESDGDYGPGDLSLREALVLANGSIGPDEITFAAGLFAGGPATITLAGTELSITDPVMIAGPGAEVLAIDGNDASRVLKVDDENSGTSHQVTISGLTITGGLPAVGEHGGGIYNREDVILVDCTVSDNFTPSVGGGHPGDGGDGGGIWNAGTLAIIRCTISDNGTGDGADFGPGSGQAGNGGGIYSDGTLELFDTIVSGNTTGDGGSGTPGGQGGDGGGIYLSSSGSLVADRTTIDGNVAGNGKANAWGGSGGGICSAGGTVELIACTISNNQSGVYASGGQSGCGGGVHAWGTLTMANCTVSGNWTDEYGGGVSVTGAGTVANVWNCTIVSNTAQAGGGIYQKAGSIFVESTIFNNDGTGGAPDVLGTVNSLGHNLVNVDSGSSGWIPGNGDLLNVGPKLSPLADNGGPTQTHALQFDSPAIDHGTNPLALTTDQRGAPFVREWPTGQADIGAYERQTADIPPLVVDTLVDEIDGDYGPGDLALREALVLANGSIGPDAIAFSAGLFEDGPATIRLELGRLMINDDVTINGPGANVLTIDAQGNSRVLAVADLDPARQTQVLISGVQLVGGDAGSGNGGGINNFEALTLSGCMISGCHAEYGGAIRNAAVGSLVIENSTLVANSATLDGAAIENNGELTVLSSTISGNEAGRYGGGIDYWDGALEVRNSTIGGNWAALYGGGLFSSSGASGTAHLWSTIVAQNTAPSGGSDIYNDVSGSSAFNLVGDGSGMGGITNGSNGNQVGVDAMLLPLRDYGGPTLTHALRAGSLAIDRGAATMGFELDQRGILRTIDLAAVPNADDGTDVGAFETHGEPLTLTVSITEDENDGDFAPNDLSLREAIALANGNDWDDAIEFDLPPGEHTITLTMGELPVTDDVIITGLGADVLAVDGNHASRVFNVDDGDYVGTSLPVSISGLTITGGLPPEGDYGGGIYNREHLTLTGCVIRDNATRDRTTPGRGGGMGGGIFNWGTLTVTACMVSGNRTGSGGDNPGGDGGNGGYGGGITSYSGNLTVTDSIISSNRTGDGGSSTSAQYHDGGQGGRGGGIFARGGLETITIHNCTVRDNTTGNGGDSAGYRGGSGGVGGGIVLDTTPTATITSSTIAGNTTGHGGTGAIEDGYGGGGGGIANWANLTISTSTVAENRTGDGGANGGAGGQGGGIVSWSNTFTMDHCAVADNRSGDGDAGGGNGGGLDLKGTVRVINSTLSGNTAGAGAAGGAIYHDTFYMGVGTLEFYNTTIYDNEVLGSGDGGGIYFHHGDMLLQSTILAGNRATNGPDLYLDPVGTPPATAIASHSLIGNNDGSNLAPAWPNPDGDGNYIGTTGAPIDPLLGPLADNAGPTMTHALQEGSVTIDHGSNPQGVTYDQRGAPFQRTAGAATDIGAFEHQLPAADANGPYEIKEGENLRLDASGSSNPDGQSLSFRWDVDGDGDFDENITGETPTLAWDDLVTLGLDDGPYSGDVTVEVSEGSDTDTDTTTLTIVESAALAVADSSGAADDANIQFTTALSQFRDGATDSTLVRPSYPDTRQYIDVTNVGSLPLTIHEIQITAPDVTITPALTDDLVLQAGKTHPFELTYAPTRPSLDDPTAQNFDLADGLVIISNAENAPAFEVALQGASTFNSDISYDGTVNLGELGPLNVNFGRASGDADWDPTTDINGDGAVNLAELGPLNAEFGRVRPTGSPAAAGATQTPAAAQTAGAELSSPSPVPAAADVGEDDGSLLAAASAAEALRETPAATAADPIEIDPPSQTPEPAVVASADTAADVTEAAPETIRSSVIVAVDAAAPDGGFLTDTGLYAADLGDAGIVEVDLDPFAPLARA